MSIRDNKRKQNRKNVTNVELANIQAMVEHTTHTTITNNPSVPPVEKSNMNTNNETDTAGITDASPEVLDEVTVDVQAETERNTVLITEWIYSLTPPTPEAALLGLNLHTVTGYQLVQAFGLPAVIPTDIATAIMAELGKHQLFEKVMPYASILVGTSRNDDGIDLSALLNTGLTFAKPYIIENVIPNIEKVYTNVMSFIKVPVGQPNVTPQSTVKPVTVTIAEKCKRIQAEADAKRAAQAKPNEPVTPVVKELNKVKLTEGTNDFIINGSQFNGFNRFTNGLN